MVAGLHAERGAVDDEVAAGEAGAEEEVRHVAGGDAVEGVDFRDAVEDGPELFEAAVEERESGAVFLCALHRDRAARATACAEDEDAHFPEIDAEGLAHCERKAGAVGAVAGEAAILADDDRIHSARAARAFVGLVHSGEHGGLVRDGAVDADEAERCRSESPFNSGGRTCSGV